MEFANGVGAGVKRINAGGAAAASAASSAAGAMARATTTAAGVTARGAVRLSQIRKWRPSRSTIALILLGVFVVLASTWLLVRNSELVAVERVRVVGLDGYYDKAARKAVVAEAKTMTTMNVSEDDLSAALGEYLDVADLRVDSDYPHKLTIFVDVRRPVAAVKIGGRIVAVTGTGLVLESTRNLTTLPSIEADGMIRDNHISDAHTTQALAVLGAAPDVLLRRVKGVEWKKRGLVLTLEKGVKLRFGNSTKAAAKWRAAAAVLASPAAKGAEYIDLRVPDRPAIGGLGAAPVTQKPALEESLQNDPAADAGSTAPTGATAPVTQTPVTQAPGVQAPATTTPATPVTQQAPAQTTPVSPVTP